MTIDLSTNPEGPYVTRDGRMATYVGTVCGMAQPYIYRIDGQDDLDSYNAEGGWSAHRTPSTEDLIPAPVEPEKRYLVVHTTWGWSNPCRSRKAATEAAEMRAASYIALLELSVDEHGIPIDGSVVKRVEL